MEGNLNEAKKAKNDEFYTLRSDIEKEVLKYNWKHKTVYCPCDAEWSQFYQFFKDNFFMLDLKELIATHLEEQQSYVLRYDGKEHKQLLSNNGSYQLQQQYFNVADVIVTNPPFSLFRDFMATVLSSKKQFLILGSQNALSYNDIFRAIKDNILWLGYNSGSFTFRVPDSSAKNAFQKDDAWYTKLGNICWYTNMPNTIRENRLILNKNKQEFWFYDNYSAIEVGAVAKIPEDYYGEMGVPITFLNKFCPKQFRIIGKSDELARPIKDKEKPGRFYLNNQRLYERIVIQKQPKTPNGILDTIRLSVSEEEVISLIASLQQAGNLYDNLRDRDDLVRFDSNVRGYIGELGIQHWLEDNGVKFYQPLCKPTVINTDLIIKGKRDYAVEIKTSMVPNADRTILRSIKNRDIKVLVNRKTPYKDGKPFIDRDLFLQVYYLCLTQERDKFCTQLHKEYSDFKTVNADKLYKLLKYDKMPCFLVAWKDKDSLLTDLSQEKDKTWGHEKRQFWKCPLITSYRPRDLLWFVR